MYICEAVSAAPLRLAGRFSQKKGWDHSGQAQRYHLLVIVEEGQCRFRLPTHEVVLRQGEGLVIPAGTFYVPTTDRLCRYAYFHFDLPLHEGEAAPRVPHDDCTPISAAFPTVALPEHFFTDETTAALFCEVLEQMRAGDMLAMNAAFLTALTRLSERDALAVRSRAQETVSAMEAYIAAHYAEPLTLTSLARQFGYTRQYVIRLFRAERQVTPTACICALRLRRGATLLLDREETVGEIARLCGFPDENYFARLFRRRYGCSPRAYRKTQRGI